MPSNTPSHTLAISEAAEAIDVSIHSLRRWCEWHSTHLSPGANPPAGQARRLTGVDIEVLRHVKALRSEGLQTVAINEQLAGLTFAEIDTEDSNAGDREEIEPTIWPDIPSAMRDHALATVRSIRPKIAKDFQGLTDEDLAIAGCVLVAEVPA